MQDVYYTDEDGGSCCKNSKVNTADVSGRTYLGRWGSYLFFYHTVQVQEIMCSVICMENDYIIFYRVFYCYYSLFFVHCLFFVCWIRSIRLVLLFMFSFHDYVRKMKNSL